MKKLLAFLFLGMATIASAGTHVQQNDPSLTIGSMTVTGGGGANVTYGVVAGSVTDSQIPNGQCLQSGPGGIITGTGQVCVSPGQNLLITSSTYSGQNQWITPAQSSFTYGLTVGSLTATNLVNGQCVQSGVGGVLGNSGGSCGSGLLTSTQTWSGQNNWTTPSQSSFTYGLTVGSETVAGPGNGQITLTLGIGGSVASTYTVTASSVVPTTNHFAVWTSTSQTLGDGGTGGGGGTPSGPTGAVQYNNAGSFGGSNNFQINSSSMVVVDTMSVTLDGNHNNPIGTFDVYVGPTSNIGQPNGSGGLLMFAVGSSQQTDQIKFVDQSPAEFLLYGIQSGSIGIGGTTYGHQHEIFDNNIGFGQEINLSNGGEMDIKTDTVGNGGKAIVFMPNVVAEVKISSYAVVVSTGLSNDPSGFYQYANKTIAQIGAIIPTPTVPGGPVTGEAYYCSNCSPAKVCISTGSAQGAFGQIQSGSTACN